MRTGFSSEVAGSLEIETVDTKIVGLPTPLGYVLIEALEVSWHVQSFYVEAPGDTGGPVRKRTIKHVSDSGRFAKPFTDVLALRAHHLANCGPNSKRELIARTPNMQRSW
jgi:hypothetical protein